MKKFSPIFASAAFVILSTSAMAATDTKKIDIEVFESSYAELIGSAVDGGTKSLEMEAMKAGKTASLGTLGIKSNGSSCSIAFETVNDFKLKHEKTGEVLKSFVLTYGRDKIKGKTKVEQKCNQDASELGLTTYGETPAIVTAGTYRDTVIVTLTAE